MIKVAQILASKGSHIFSIAPDEPVLSAIELMAEKGVGAVLVMKGDELVGVISERDYARKIILHGRASAQTGVWEIMSSPVISVSPDDTVNSCMMLMTEKKIRHLPVVEKNVVVGVLSIGDLVKAVIEQQEREIAQLQNYIAG
jgi:CBS domain-containing protein